MTRMRLMLAALALVVLTGFPTVTMALPQYARSIVYFDANDNIIGNQNLYCNNYREHAGDIDPANANRVEFRYGCGDPIVSCDRLGLCQTVGHNTFNTVVYFHSATGRTIQNYCLDYTAPGLPFYGNTACDLPEPSEIVGLGPYLEGFN